MIINLKRIGVLALILAFWLGLGAGGLAQGVKITWQEALHIVFAESPHFSLFLKEQELASKRARQAQRPDLDLSITALELGGEGFEGPRAKLSATLPLGPALALEGSLTWGSPSLWETAVSADLSLDYSLLAFNEAAAQEISPAEALLAKQNELALQTINLLIQLRKNLDREDYLQERYLFLERFLAASQAAPSFDSLKLKEEQRDLAGQLRDLQDEVDLLQLELASLLKAPLTTFYEPFLEVKPGESELQLELYHEDFLRANAAWRAALEKLESAQNRLEHERKTKGWDAQISGNAVLNGEWRVGLTVTKTLYPRGIILEELELALAQAQIDFQEQEITAQSQFKAALKKIEAGAFKIEQYGQSLEEAFQDFELLQRQLQAGLITPWVLKEAELQIGKIRIDYKGAQLDYVQTLLGLYGQCGAHVLGKIGVFLN